MLKCSVCGFENPDDGQVCLNCGSPMERPKLGAAMDDINGEATVMLGMPMKNLPPAAPKAPAATPSAAPPPPPAPVHRPTAPPPPPARPAMPPPPPSSSMGSAPPPPPAPMMGSVPLAPPTSGMAIAALVTGILAFSGCACYGIPNLILGGVALVLGFKARADIKNSGGATGGDGLALAGMICGGVNVAISLLIIAYLVIVMAFFATGGAQ